MNCKIQGGNKWILVFRIVYLAFFFRPSVFPTHLVCGSVHNINIDQRILISVLVSQFKKVKVLLYCRAICKWPLLTMHTHKTNCHSGKMCMCPCFCVIVKSAQGHSSALQWFIAEKRSNGHFHCVCSWDWMKKSFFRCDIWPPPLPITSGLIRKCLSCSGKLLLR